MQPPIHTVIKTTDDWIQDFENAAVTGDLNQFKVLCSKEYSEISCVNQELNQAFRFACAYGHLNIVRFLTTSQEFLNLGYQWVNLAKPSRHQGLRFACINGHLEIIRYLVESIEIKNAGQKVNLHDNDEEAFRFACSHGHLEVIKYLTTSPELLAAGHTFVDIHALNEEGLQQACSEGHLDVVKFLTTSADLRAAGHYFPDIHATNDLAFQRACQGGHLEVVKFLLMSPELEKSGYPFCEGSSFVDVHADDDADWRVLCQREYWDVVEWLLFEYGVDETPKIEASKKQYPQVQEYFRIRDEKLEFKDLLSPPEKVEKRSPFEGSVRRCISRAREWFSSEGSSPQRGNQPDVNRDEPLKESKGSSQEWVKEQDTRSIRRL